MTDYEKLIDLIINEDEDQAKALFHKIVVEQSRKIYESLIEDVEQDTDVEGLGDEVVADETGEGDTEFGADEFNADADDVVGDDEVAMDDEVAADVAADGELEDRVMDLENALDDLKAEFEQLMAQEEDEGHEFDGAHESLSADEENVGGEVDVGDEFDFDSDSDIGDFDLDDSARGGRQVQEDLQKVAAPKNAEGQEVGNGKSVGVNKTSTVAGKNDMGGSAKNIAQGGGKDGCDGNKPCKPSKPVKQVGDKFQNKVGGDAKLAPAKKPELKAK